jgi:hypothetical protein
VGLKDPKTRKTIAVGKSLIQERAAGGGYGDKVAAESRAIATLSREIAAELESFKYAGGSCSNTNSTCFRRKFRLFSISIFPQNFLNGFLLALRLHPSGISIWDHCQWQMEEKSNPL